MTTPIEPNILAFQNADILAALQDATTPGNATTAWTKRSLAAHVARDESNVAKTLKRLTEEGLLLADPMAGLTDEGRAQLAAFNRARHGGERRKAQGRWRAAGLQRNPLNRPVDRQHVHDIAETIEAAGDVLVPIVVSPPDAHGVRTIWAGEHRWEAVKYLTNLDRCPEVLKDDGILFTEREATPGEAAVIALIENSTRRDLTPWQDAQQLKAAADGLNLNASDLARRIGRASEGSRGGLRDVQVKLKVAREASPEAIQAYTADPSAPGAWERLRDSVSEKKAATEIVLTKAQRLALAELWASVGNDTAVTRRVLPSAHTAEGARLAQYGLAILIRDDLGDRARVTQAGAEYLTAEHLSYRLSGIAYAREKLGYPGGWGRTEMRTEWLNLPHAHATANAADPATKPDPELEALRGIEPIRAAKVGPGILDAERWTLPHDKPGRGPIAEIEFGRIEGQGWIVATRASLPNGGWDAPFSDCPANASRYVSRTEAACAAIDIVRKELITHHVGQGLTLQIEKWLMALDPERGPNTATDTTDPWLEGGWRPYLPAGPGMVGTSVGPTLIAPTRALIADARGAPMLTLYRRHEGRHVGTGDAMRIEQVTLYRARATITLPDGREIESSRIPGASDVRAAIQLATEDLLYEAGDDKALIRPAVEWLDGMSGPFVVGGKNCLNASRAQERRFALGWDKRQSNSGGAPRILDEAEPDDAVEAAEAMADLRTSNSAAEPAAAPPRQRPALALIRVERERQQEAEGYSPEQDDEQNGDGELSQAAAAYAVASCGDPDAALFWPGGWAPDMFKPTGQIRDLVKAGALILAEIERRLRAGETA